MTTYDAAGRAIQSIGPGGPSIISALARVLGLPLLLFLSDDEILRRLVELNRERAEEEKRGIIRWLRPEFQNKGGAPAAAASQPELPIEEPAAPAPVAASFGSRRPWPRTLPEQAQAVRAALAENPAGLTAEAMARLFLRSRAQTVADLLKTLVSLGQARSLEDGTFVST